MTKTKRIFCLLALTIVAFPQTAPRPSVASLPDAASNLPLQTIGIDDLLGISVYDAPEFTRTVRVGKDGHLRLPMLKRRIRVAGLLPGEAEEAIANALQVEEILVEPIVTVSVVEYGSRPVTVAGAVKHPTTFQASGKVTLLDALSRAEGISENSGPEVLVSLPVSTGAAEPERRFLRISLKSLIDGTDPSANILLHGGEQVRVPEAGKLYVVGNVKKPGAFLIRDSNEASILKALALSEGLTPYAGSIAYIYRREGATAAMKEIPVELKKIMNRKLADVALRADDVFYIPDRSGHRIAMAALEKLVVVGTGFGTTALYVTR